MNCNVIKSALFGLSVADALGVPVEFKSRAYLKSNPVTNMFGFGSHNQPIGTWSDDSSLAFCLADSLCNGYDLKDIAHKFLQWRNEEIWTPHGKIFDIGIATNEAINRIESGQTPSSCGGFEEKDNGNGSLMRIMPLVFHLQNETDLEKIFEITKAVSSITHAHFRSVLACFIYIVYILEILKGLDKLVAYQNTQTIINRFCTNKNFKNQEIKLFARILEADISELNESEIFSTGYVIHTLEASFWCFLNANSYSETVLKAINLGDDTDTTACVAGGIAGIYFGLENIPKSWMENLVKSNEINALAEKLYNRLNLNKTQKL
jgi:ADP-ribosylglycohydrolase